MPPPCQIFGVVMGGNSLAELLDNLLTDDRNTPLIHHHDEIVSAYMSHKGVLFLRVSLHDGEDYVTGHLDDFTPLDVAVDVIIGLHVVQVNVTNRKGGAILHPAVQDLF